MPMSGKPDQRLSYDQVYPLYAGLHSYTTGLERLLKLTISCHVFLQDGAFPNLRRYGHKLSSLLDALGNLEPSYQDPSSWNFFERPADDSTERLVAWLERYADGAGRYEILDSLSREDSGVPTWSDWQTFCVGASVSDQVRRIISMHSAVGDALRLVSSEADLESVATPHLHELDGRLHEPSVAVALSMHRLARWPASCLDAITHYTHNGLPILGEVLVVLEQQSEDFFAYEVARIADPDVAEEELLAHLDKYSDHPSQDDFGEGDWA